MFSSREATSLFISLASCTGTCFCHISRSIDDTGWTGWLYRCHCRHGYPNVLRALRPHVMVVDDWRHASRRWFGIVVSIQSPDKTVRLPYNFAYREGVKATYMSSLAAYVCDDMASISRQPCMLLVSFKLTGTTRVPRKSSLYYNIVSMCAGVYLQGPLGFFKFFELFASIARSRSRSPNDIVSANSCIQYAPSFPWPDSELTLIVIHSYFLALTCTPDPRR